MRQLLYSILAVLCVLMPHQARAETPSISRIKAITAELGYKPTATTDTVTLDNLGEHQSTVTFIVANDKSSFQIYASWSIPNDKRDAIPTLAMLKANSSSPFAFAVYGKDEKLSFDLEATYDASVFGKPLIKKIITQLVEAIDGNEELWNTDKWPAPGLAKIETRSASPMSAVAAAAAAVATGAPAPARSYAALQEDADKAWLAAPLSIKRALLLSDKARDYGVYTIRPNAVFKRGDTAFLYVEPANYDWGAAVDGVYTFGVTADLGLKGKTSDVDVVVPDFMKLPLANRNRLKNLYLAADIALKDTLPLGDYTLRLTLHDTNSGKVATAEFPFTLRE